MVTHRLFQGGNRTEYTFPPKIFPQCDVTPDQFFQPDNRGAPGLYAVPRRILWNDGNSGKCGTDVNFASSDGLAQYLENLETPIAVGDVIQVLIIPKEHSLERVWVKIIDPCPGFTFDVRVRGNAASLGGTPAIPAPVVTTPGVNGAVVGSALDVITPPLYFNQNDMLEIVITGLGPLGIGCSDFIISGVLQGYCGHHGNN